MFRLEQKDTLTDPLKKIELFKAVASPAYIVASLEHFNEVSADFFCPVKKCFEFACEANFRKSTIPEYKREYDEIENRLDLQLIAKGLCMRNFKWPSIESTSTFWKYWKLSKLLMKTQYFDSWLHDIFKGNFFLVVHFCIEVCVYNTAVNSTPHILQKCLKFNIDTSSYWFLKASILHTHCLILSNF